MKSSLLALLLVVGLTAQEPIPPADDAARVETILKMYRGYKENFPRVRDVTPLQVEKMRAEGFPFVLVDVRKEKERAVSTIPGAISREEFERRREEFRGHLIISYCTIGYRSGRYLEKLARKGFQAANLAGSILLWAHQGGTLAHEGKPTRRIHVYAETWDLAPAGFEGVW